MKNGVEVDEEGNKFHYSNDQLHRIDGPAIEWADGEFEWYYKGNLIDCNSQEDFNVIKRLYRNVELKAFW